YTHAFFKALLFLGSGAVIHALSGEQDLRRMGGLKKDLPITYWTFFIGALAIAGVPGLAGFFSKDEILYRTFASGHTVLWVVGLVTSLLTACYMFRVVHLAFHGTRARNAQESSHGSDEAAGSHGAAGLHGSAGEHLHDAAAAMAIALIVLAIGSVLGGYIGLPGANRLERFLEPSFTAGQDQVETEREAATATDSQLEGTLMVASTFVAMSGIGIATFFFLKRRRAADEMALRFAGLHRLLSHKYYVDEIYNAAIVEPVRIISEQALWKGVDVRVIDGAVNGVGDTVTGGSAVLRRLQTGSVRAYAGWLFLGVVFVLGYYVWR